MWSTIQIVFVVLGLLLAYGGDRLSMPILFYGGMACFGLAAMAIGAEGIFTQRIVLGRRRRRTTTTYTGIPAVLQGVQFSLIGLFFIAISGLLYLNIGRDIFVQFVRRPGFPLVILGSACLLQAVIAIMGSHEIKQGPRWVVILSLFTARLYPGLLLIVIGLAAIGAGLFEIAAPAAFDEMGGRALEELYGLNR
ncbi:MAG TPA: hypothetical protein VFQ23_16410 [Anaerolineales bacterium]|nr:hypothetical protein [Anaerolineales bacterium]